MFSPSDVSGVASAEAHRDQCRDTILCELVDAALQENLFGLRERVRVQQTAPIGLECSELPLGGAERYALVTCSASQEFLVFRACSGDPLQSVRCSRPPVLVVTVGGCRVLSPAEVLSWFVESQLDQPGQARVIADLRLAERQGRLARSAASAVAADLAQAQLSLADWERLAALRDRPFHPVARARREWSDDDYRRYSGEAARRWPLHWIAVRRAHVLQAPCASADPASWLLCEEQREALAAAMLAKGLAPADYLAIPAHPWQARCALPRLFAEEIAREEIVPLPIERCHAQPSASLRTVMPEGDPRLHLKLSLAVSSLGALRPLPPRYLHNGSQAQRVLMELRARDPVLAESMDLCDETLWWCHVPAASELPPDYPGHLACNLRRYPAPIGAELIPMASFAVILPDGRLPAFDYILARRGEYGPSAALALFEDLALRLCEIGLACFRVGVMPEAHGQNVLAEFDGGRLARLVLRDHDTLRIHEPWLEAAGLAAPDYRIDRSSPNTLILQCPQALLAYFQTLALQVNLRAIGHALAQVYETVSLGAVWRVIERTAHQAVAHTNLDGPAADVLRASLFDAREWPSKLLLTPLLAQSRTTTGMPSSLGDVPNPFRHCAWNVRA